MHAMQTELRQGCGTGAARLLEIAKGLLGGEMKL